LKTVPISAASAQQRAGRAGRVAAGVCVRLWPEREALTPHTSPQIELDDLAGLALTLAVWGAPTPAAIAALQWVTPPPPHALSEAHDLLRGLGAMEYGEGGGLVVTKHGRAVARLPLHPRLAHMLLITCSWGFCNTMQSLISISHRSVPVADVVQFFFLPLHPRLAHMLLLAPRVGGARATRIACAIAALIEERDLLSDPRSVGAHVLPRVTALLASSPGPGVDEVRCGRGSANT
jgi:HrpA-like RNA helicase